MSLHSLPLFVRLGGRAVILLGEGEAADAKRRLLERGGAVIVDEDAQATLAVVALEDEGEAIAAVARLRARGLLVNAVDRPEQCDFTWPAIVDRDPVIVAIGTGGVSAGLAAALRQRIEATLPNGLGRLAQALHDARAALRRRWPDGAERRRALADGLGQDGPLDPFEPHDDSAVTRWIDGGTHSQAEAAHFILTSADPDDLTLRQARALASADRLLYRAGVPTPILDRARADAPRIVCAAPPDAPMPGDVYLEML